MEARTIARHGVEDVDEPAVDVADKLLHREQAPAWRQGRFGVVVNRRRDGGVYEQAGRVAVGAAACEAVVLGQQGAEGGRVEVLVPCRAEHGGKLCVEGDQLLGDVLALGVVGGEDARLATALQDQGQLPGQVVCVLHADVHALARLGRVCVAGVAEEEDVLAGVGEGGAQALRDAVPADPVDVRDG